MTVPSAGHIAAQAGCADTLLRDFYDEPTGALDVGRDCIADLKRSPFFVRATGPNP